MVIALVIACAFFMETFTGTVITTALPAMARSFGSDAVHLSLGVTAYLVSLAIFIPLSGWVADRHGARTVFCAAIGVFIVASVLCGLSNDLLELVAARIVQGIGGAMMVPVGRLVLLRSVDKSEYMRATAYLIVPAFLGQVIAPPVGGFITTFVSWRWVFFINVPIGLVGMALALRLIQNFRETHTPPLDWLGFLLSGIALALILYSLDLAAGAGRGIDAVAVLALGLGLGVLAVLHARRHPHPLIALSLFRLPTFAIGLLGGAFFRIGAGSMPFLLPVFFQLGLGMTAFVSGLLILADPLGHIAMDMGSPAVLRRTGFRRVLVYVGTVAALAIAACALIGASTPFWAIFVGLFVSGVVRSLQWNALNNMLYADIPAREMSSGTSLASMTQQLCSGAGIAVGALLLQAALTWRGAGPGGLVADDARFAIIALGLFAGVTVLFCLRLRADAGAAVSGHGRARGST